MSGCTKCGQNKTWKCDNPECPFSKGGVFGDNWNCGIINRIRNICEVAMDGRDNRLHYQYCDDQKYVTIKTDDIASLGLCLWVSWYKSRGRTDAMWILDNYDPPRVPSFDELIAIIEYYEEENNN